MEINIKELKTITSRLLEHLEEKYGDRIVINHDYYWDIEKDEYLDYQNTPKELSVGQFTEDWEKLLDILRNDELKISYALVWLSSILKYIGLAKVE
jgi:predicted choloylglycine hydrolase